MPISSLVESPQVRSAQGTVLTKAVLLAADKLDVKQASLAAILGVSGSFLLISAALICRLALCWAIERAIALPRHRYALIPVQDAIAFAIFLTSFFGREVEWRGKTYTVADGFLSQSRR